MGVPQVSYQEHELVDGTSMRNLVSRKLGQSHLRNQLVYEDDDANGADEASQKRPAEYVVQKSESEDTCCQDEGACQRSNDACNLCVSPSIIIA